MPCTLSFLKPIDDIDTHMFFKFHGLTVNTRVRCGEKISFVFDEDEPPINKKLEIQNDFTSFSMATSGKWWWGSDMKPNFMKQNAVELRANDVVTAVASKSRR
jgi:hypothetical protein